MSNNYYKTHNIQPEIELLKLAAGGVDTNLSPSLEDFEEIVKNLSDKRLVILFKWFWKHSDVVNFAEHFIKKINANNLAWYLRELSKVIGRGVHVHWVERINLFHVYGLSRLFDKKAGLEIMESTFDYGERIKSIQTLSDISACNVSLILKEAGTIDSLKVIEAMSSPSLLSIFGLYQLFYYEGLPHLLNVLKEYVHTPKEVIIPQTIAGLFSAEPTSLIIAKAARDRIYDEILYYLPEKVVSMLAAIDKMK